MSTFDNLDMGNILSGDEAAALFTDDTPQETQTSPQSATTEEPATKPSSNDDTNNNEDVTTEVADSLDLFDEEDTKKTPSKTTEEPDKKPESVSSEKDTEGQGNTNAEQGDDSPKVYSSLLKALKVDGVLPDLADSDISDTVSPEQFRDLMMKQVKSELDDAQRRVLEALDNGVKPDVVRFYENSISYLNSVTADQLTEESEQGEKLRKQIISQDFMNKGFTPEKAEVLVNKLIETGSDIEEAQAALESNKEYFSKCYQEVQEKAKEATAKEQKQQQAKLDKLKEDIMSSETAFGSIPMDKATRKKVYDNVTKPIFKDDEGNYYTAVQKYKKDNPGEFIKNIGLLYTLTNGFKDIENVIKPQTKKEVKSALKELEQTLNNTQRNSDGTLHYVTTAKDSESHARGSIFDKGFQLDTSIFNK